MCAKCGRLEWYDKKAQAELLELSRLLTTAAPSQCRLSESSSEILGISGAQRSTATVTRAAAHTRSLCRSKQPMAEFDGMSHGLVEACFAKCPISFTYIPPTEILEGGVKMIHNRNLSYAPKVNWLDIVKDGMPNIVMEGNGPESECEMYTSINYLLHYKF